ncbi:MAG TPA: sodium:solute symporter [Candidatus Sulfotelmatobacter sp.]|jgi:SSS family solute:Na+ symporter|nr:sodium:solute symporter [Candidatus Sulfotelmatobacter sp.]
MTDNLAFILDAFSLPPLFSSHFMRIHPLDLAIVLLYLLAVTALGIYFRRSQRDVRDYFLGGRTAPWWAIAFSIVATETSTLTIIGTPAIAYGGNLTFLQLVFGYLIGRILIVLLLLPGYFRGEFFTAYALIEKRFGPRMRSLAASTFLITRAIAEGVRVSAIALVLSVVLGTSERFAVFLVIALTILYTFEGGMKAVIWTDVAQLLLYLAGSAVTFWFLLHRIPGGWAEVTQVAAASGHKLQLFDFSFSLATKYTFWSGLIGGAFLTMASHGTDQTIVQRLLAAKNEKDSRAALIASGFIVLFQFTLFLLVGVLLFVFSQHTPLLSAGQRLDAILPTFLVREMPTGLAGILFASILAVAMSNASGSLNSLAASTVLDFSRLSGHQTNPAKFLRLSRRITLVWGAVLICFGLISWGPLLEAGLTVASMPFGSLLGLFLLGTLDRKAAATGAAIGMFAGLAAILSVWRFTPIAFTWYVLIGCAVTFLVGSLMSRILPASAPVQEHSS